MRIENQKLQIATSLAKEMLGKFNSTNKIKNEQQVITNCGGSCSGSCSSSANE